mgnify:CR=1 FL=1
MIDRAIPGTSRTVWTAHLGIDYSRPVELDFMTADMPRDFFIEEKTTHLPSRRGWAPPRKRPRRVHRKLADRGFAAHFGGPQHGAQQRERHTERGPTIQRELNKPPVPGERLTFRAPDYMFDGQAWTKAPPEMVSQSAWNGGTYIQQRLPPPALLCPTTSDEVSSVVVERIEWRAREWGFAGRLLARDVDIRVRVHAPVHLRMPAEVIEQHIERRGGAMMAELIFAWHPRSYDGHIIARQTSYRPHRG